MKRGFERVRSIRAFGFAQGKLCPLSLLLLLLAAYTPMLTATPLPAPTATPTAAPTATPIPTDTLSGTVFFDYNGDGAQDSNEPGISGASVQIDKLTTTTTADGKYTLSGVARGNQQIRLSATGFRHISPSLEVPQPSDQPASPGVNGDTQRNWGLMQGFLTLPFKCCPNFIRTSPFGMTGMFHVDRKPGYVRSYNLVEIRPDYVIRGIAPWAYDQHDGIDYSFVEGTEIVAAAPGVVTETTIASGGDFFIIIQHPYDKTQTLYGHLSQFLVRAGQKVSKGQVIAKSEDTGISSEPHLHFRYAAWTTPQNPIDPYRDLTNSDSLSYWTVDNNPQYPE